MKVRLQPPVNTIQYTISVLLVAGNGYIKNLTNILRRGK